MNSSVHSRLSISWIGRHLQATLAVLMGALAFWTSTPSAHAADSAVVIMYHRFGEPTFPSTNIRLSQFEEHVAELQSGPYTVLPLPEIIGAIRTGTTLPDRTVGISIDDAYQSVYVEAWPRLAAAGLPFTVFVATNTVDRGSSDYMGWDLIREMARSGVTIGSQTASHLHMPAASTEDNRADIERSNQRFRDELGRVPELFAYPYGEASLAVADVVRDSGFVAAFGQHSGAFGSGDDMFFLPRFAMNERYGDQQRFLVAVNALPVPVSEIIPADPLVTGPNPPSIGFTVGNGVNGLQTIACYASHQSGKVRLERLGERRIEIRLDRPFRTGRNRINCTIPAGQGRWHWWGRQFVVLE